MAHSQTAPFLIRVTRSLRARPYRLAEVFFSRVSYVFAILTVVALQVPALSPEAAILFSRLDAASGVPVPAITGLLCACSVAVAVAAMALKSNQGPGRVVASLSESRREALRGRARRPVASTVPVPARVPAVSRAPRRVQANLPSWALEFQDSEI